MLIRHGVCRRRHHAAVFKHHGARLENSSQQRSRLFSSIVRENILANQQRFGARGRSFLEPLNAGVQIDVGRRDVRLHLLQRNRDESTILRNTVVYPASDDEASLCGE